VYTFQLIKLSHCYCECHTLYIIVVPVPSLARRPKKLIHNDTPFSFSAFIVRSAAQSLTSIFHYSERKSGIKIEGWSKMANLPHRKLVRHYYNKHTTGHWHNNNTKKIVKVFLKFSSKIIETWMKVRKHIKSHPSVCLSIYIVQNQVTKH